ncbi:alpha/beta-hydrolase [Thozetella sp. PMI_491]|nr:alpha/beta-hydrolase [Thozetella sp. PMI_491]
MPLPKDVTEFIKGMGNAWSPNVNAACEAFFTKCHSAQPQTTPQPFRCTKNISYGPYERNRLDVYQPTPTDEAPSNALMVVYFHGGGFSAGDNDISEHIHGNIAKVFAHHRMVGILATYRLLPDARFPEGMEDVAAALRWVKDHAREYGGDESRVFVIGQSAGGAHLAMALFSGLLRQIDAVPRGIVLQSAPFWYDLTQARRKANMLQYYAASDEDGALKDCGLSMFRRLGTIDAFETELFITVAEFDFDECVRGNMMFLEACRLQMKRLPRFEVLHGHNHVSYALSMGLEGDEIGPKILSFVQRVIGEAES